MTILRKPKASQFFFGMQLCPNFSVKKSFKKKHDYGFSGDSLFSVSNLNPNYVSDDESSFEDQGFSYNFALGITFGIHYFGWGIARQIEKMNIQRHLGNLLYLYVNARSRLLLMILYKALILSQFVDSYIFNFGVFSILEIR